MTPWPVDKPVPAVCLLPEVLSILRMSRTTFNAQMKSGRLPIHELPRTGHSRRFCGTSVQRAIRVRELRRSA